MTDHFLLQTVLMEALVMAVIFLTEVRTMDLEKITLMEAKRIILTAKITATEVKDTDSVSFRKKK